MRGSIIPSAVLTQWHRLRVVLPSRRCPSHRLKKKPKNQWKKFIVSPHVRYSRTVLDSGFHAVDSGFQVLDSGFYLCRFRIPKHKTFQILVLVFFFFLVFSSRNDFNSEFRYWRTCCANACLSINISMTTFDNYKKYITANQEINFSSKNTYWDCPFLKSNVHSFHIFLATLKRCTIFLSFRFLKVLQVI